jgi:ribosomal protein S4
VNIPSFEVKAGSVIKIAEKSQNLDIIRESLKEAGKGLEFDWLRLDKVKLEGQLLEYRNAARFRPWCKSR